MDVDGYECDVLRGAGETLRGLRPTLLVELAPYVLEERGSSLGEYVDLLTANGYRLLSESGLDPLPTKIDELSTMIGEDSAMNAVVRPI